MTDGSLTPRQQGQIATLAGFLSPLVGILLMIILAVLVNVVVGIIVGAIAVLVMVPITQRLLRRRSQS